LLLGSEIITYSPYCVEKLLRLNTNKKEILKLMSDKKTEVESFIKQNNLSVKDRVDLLQIFKFYNAK
jgi:hypothetical protein